MPQTTDPLPVTRFTTDAFRPQDRHDAWANRDWPTIGPVFQARPLGAFHNRSDRFALGAIGVHFADMAAQRYVRSAAKARRDGFDQLTVSITLTGTARGESNGIDWSTGDGSLCLGDLSQPQAHQSSDSRTILLAVPRLVAERASLDVRALHGVQLAPRRTALLRTHLVAVHAALPDLSVAQGAMLERSVLDLLSVALAEGGVILPATAAARDAALALEARRIIDMRLDAATLDSAWLCAHLRVSRSRLYGVFKDAGGVQAYIRARRLDRIRDILATAPCAERIADLADHWGFSDAAHLGRAFRERFGIAPGEFRDSRSESGR